MKWRVKILYRYLPLILLFGYYDLIGQGVSSSVSSSTDFVQNIESESVILPAGTRIRMQLLKVLSTRQNKPGDIFRAEVIEDILLGKQLIVPKFTLGNAVITRVKRAGRIRGRASMNFNFRELEFQNGKTIDIEGRVVSLEQGLKTSNRQRDPEIKDDEGTLQSEGAKSADVKKVGISSAFGTLIGVLAGGKRGAARGAVTGAAVGVAGTLISRGRDLYISPQTKIIIELNEDVEIFPWIPKY